MVTIYICFRACPDGILNYFVNGRYPTNLHDLLSKPLLNEVSNFNSLGSLVQNKTSINEQTSETTCDDDGIARRSLLDPLLTVTEYISDV